MYTLVLIRHGESLWNRENRFTGWTDIDLSDQGRQEAREAGRLLKTSGFEFDVAFTSYLKRAIRTLWLMLDEMDQMWIPVQTHWRLNERHYGALTGLKKDEIAAKFGESQVHLWRRSFDVPPDALNVDDPRYPTNDRRYSSIPPQDVPRSECLKDTIARVVPYWTDTIARTILSGKKVLVVSHGNTLRALVKHLANFSEEDITAFNIPTGVPLVFQLDENLRPISFDFLGDQDAIRAAISAVENQGKSAG